MGSSSIRYRDTFVLFLGLGAISGMTYYLIYIIPIR